MTEKEFCSEHTTVIKIISENSTSLKDIKTSINQIKNNHLVHIYARLNRIQLWLIGLLTSVILGLVLTILRSIK